MSHTISPPDPTLVESTLIAYRQLLGETPGGAYYNGPDLKWSWTGQSHLNMVFGAHLAVADIDDRVKQLHTYFGQRQIVYVNWLIGPSSLPGDLDIRLVQKYGAHPIDGQASVHLNGMVLDLNDLATAKPIEDVTVEEVYQTEALETWLDLCIDHPVRREVMQRLIQSNGSKFCAYLCRVRGVPVGTALIYEGPQAIALRNVYIQEDARGKGLGRWLSWYVLDASRPRHRMAITDATTAGEVVYRGLGFETCCPLYEYAVRIPLEEDVRKITVVAKN